MQALRQRDMLSFALYLVGSIVCIAGVAWIATLLGVAGAYVTMAAAVFLGIAVFGAAAHRRATEPPTT
jgi:hypothetical protein